MTNIRTLAIGTALALGIGSVAGAQSTQGMEKGKHPAAHEGGKHEGDHGMRDHGMRDHGMRDHGMRDHGMSRKHPFGHAMKGITLTDAQKDQVKAINAKYRDEFEALRPQGRENGARPDSATRAQMMSRRMEIEHRQMAEIRTVLTSSQQATFDANVAQMKEKADAWREKRGGRGAKKGS